MTRLAATAALLVALSAIALLAGALAVALKRELDDRRRRRRRGGML